MDDTNGTASPQPADFAAEGAPHETHLPSEQPLRHAVSPPRTGRIVVGVDGSPESVKALSRAADLANVLNTRLEIITTWRPYVGYAEMGATDWSPERDAQEISAEAAGAEFGDVLPDWVTRSLREGNAIHQLIEASTGADMLVVGSRGHGGVVGLLLGSVSSACAEEAHCPVLVVR